MTMVVPETIQDLRRLVEERLEETVRLEFKRQLPEPGKNDDMCKDLAAMANSEGGVIIYGIDEDAAEPRRSRPSPSQAPRSVPLSSHRV